MPIPDDKNLTAPFQRRENDVVEMVVGAVIDRRYLLKREIARGGMAIVFEAEHLVLGRRVALKSLSAAVGDLRWGRERLMREARALDTVSGHGIVRVFDAGHESTEPYLVMELLEGRSLDTLLAARGRLEASTACSVVQQLCASLVQHCCSAGYDKTRPWRRHHTQTPQVAALHNRACHSCQY